MTHKFDPDYVVPTSEVLQEWLDYSGQSVRVASACLGKKGQGDGMAVLNNLLADLPISESDAVVLHYVTGIRASFWVNFEHNYRVGLAAGKKAP